MDGAPSAPALLCLRADLPRPRPGPTHALVWLDVRVRARLRMGIVHVRCGSASDVDVGRYLGSYLDG
jgi:hypothetical protein